MKLHFTNTTAQNAHIETPEPRARKTNSGEAAPASQPRSSTYEKVVEAEFNVVRQSLVSEARLKVSSGYYNSPEVAARVADAILESE